MRTPYKRLLPVPLLMLLATGIAQAQTAPAGGGGGAESGKAAGIGVGGETMLAGPEILAIGPGFDFFFPTSAASFCYDATMWRVNALLAMESAGGTDIFLGGRFWYVLHNGVASDFSVGGGLGLIFDGDDNPGPGADDDRTHILIEGGIQLRAFVVPNVAVGATAGIGFVVLDDDNADDFFFIGGQLLGQLGIWYFFD